MSKPNEIVTTFYAAGVTNAIMAWVRGNQKYSLEEMTECIKSLLLPTKQ